jgi:hypothetical protein
MIANGLNASVANPGVERDAVLLADAESAHRKLLLENTNEG